jgi:heterodisulfide reductase subunit A
MSEKIRIGVFTCDCVLISKHFFDLQGFEAYAKTLPNVVFTEILGYSCSKNSQEILKKRIKEYQLNRVVLAACSPRHYETLFRRCLEEAGLNPYLLELVNIREQAIWPHKTEGKRITEKAKNLLRAAIYRVIELEPITTLTYYVPPVVLIVGAGVSGIQAAQALSDQNIHVHLVERGPSIGGKAAQLGTVYPNESCGVCIPPRLAEVSRECLVKRGIQNDPNINLHTLTEVTQLSGGIGNFHATLHTKPRGVIADKCTMCGICIEECPISIPDTYNAGLSTRKAIYLPYPQSVPKVPVIDFSVCNRCGKCVEACPVDAINLEEEETKTEMSVGTVIVATGFEIFQPIGMYGFGQYPNVITNFVLTRMLDPLGPTNGQVLRPSDSKPPDRIGFIQCVGSRDPEHYTHCSRICCMITVKMALSIKKQRPQTQIDVFFKDIRLLGKDYEKYYLACQDLGVNFHRAEVTKVTSNRKKGLVLSIEKTNQKTETFSVDLLSLATALIPSTGSKELADMLHLEVDPSGFFCECHKKLVPIDTTSEGIFITGCCTGPRDIAECSYLGAAAASHAALPMIQSILKESPIKAIVDDALCIGCANCFDACPYNAIRMEGGVSIISEVDCKGCGICVVECPAKAIQLQNFRDSQLEAQIKGLLLPMEVAK